MRILTQEGICTQYTEIRHSSHDSKRIVHGQTHHFTNSGLGKKQNIDYEPLHHKDI